jgi:hypothetical protein
MTGDLAMPASWHSVNRRASAMQIHARCEQIHAPIWQIVITDDYIYLRETFMGRTSIIVSTMKVGKIAYATHYIIAYI